MTLIDSHCHLDAEEYDADRSDVLARAWAAGVTAVVVPGTDRRSSSRAVDLVEEVLPEGPRLFAAVGIHPHSASEHDADAMAALEELSGRSRVVAVGETGLDFHYNFSPPERQRDSLRDHVRLARRRRLPLVLHCRAAEDDLLAILEEEGARECGGVVHCFTGSGPMAERLLEMGFFLGFTGIVTFKNSADLRKVAAGVPADRILLETDGPYLAPIPFRGRRNEPSYLPRVAEVLAEERGTTAQELAEAARRNTIRCFHLVELE